MVKKLVSRAEFARLANVSAAAVTKACSSNVLKTATVGKRIDALHPVAVGYLESHNRDPETSPAPGIDPLYEDVVKLCQENGRWSVTFLQRHFRIGWGRASQIMEMVRAAGLIPETTKAPPASKPAAPKKPYIRGHAAKNESKKKQAREDLRERLENGDTLHEIPEDIREFADMSLREIIERFGTDVAFGDWLKATKAIEDINDKRIKNAKSRGDLVHRDLIKVGIIDPIDAAHTKLLTDGAKTISRRATAMHDAGRSLGEIEKFVANQITSFIRPMKAKVGRTLKNV